MTNTKEFLINFLSDSSNFQFDEAGVSVDAPDLILITAAGTIKGTPLIAPNKPTEDTEPAEYFADTIFSTIQQKAASVEDRTCSSILLKDAELIIGTSQRISYGFLYVFLDDVIAVTIAS